LAENIIYIVGFWTLFILVLCFLNYTADKRIILQLLLIYQHIFFLKETEQKKLKTTKINWSRMEFDLLIFDCKENLHGRWKWISLNIFKSGGLYSRLQG
jgi:hypothetical protein